MWQPRLGVSWDPRGNGKHRRPRQRRALLRAHPRPEPRLVALDQRQPRPDDFPQQRAHRHSRGGARVSRTSFPGVGDRHPVLPGRLRLRPGLQRTRAPSRRAWRSSTRSCRTSPSSSSTTTRRGDHITRFLNRNDPLLGSPWSSGLGPGRHQRHRRRLTTVTSTAREPVRRRDLRPHQAPVPQRPVPGQLHHVVGQVGRRQRARPVLVPLRANHRPRRRVRLLRPRPAAPLQRLPALGRHRGRSTSTCATPYRSAQPLSLNAAGGVSQAPVRQRLGPDPRRRVDRPAQHRPQGQHLLGARPADLA